MSVTTANQSQSKMLRASTIKLQLSSYIITWQLYKKNVANETFINTLIHKIVPLTNSAKINLG